MSIFIAPLSLFSLTLGIGLAGTALAEDSKKLLANRVEDFASYRELDHRISVKIDDCLYISERWEPLFGAEEILTGILTIDLTSAMLEMPPPMRMMIDTALEKGKTPILRDEGTAIVYWGEGKKLSAMVNIVVRPPKTILREEHVGRKRTQSLMKARKFRPSPRGDGKTFIFRETPDVSIKAEGQQRVAQLQDFEKSLEEYQARYCFGLNS